MNSPPEKGKGALQAPIPKLNQLTTTVVRLPLQPCAHPVTRTERFPGGQPHSTHEVCATCGRHVRWFPKPATIERRKLNAYKLARLSLAEGLSDWERSFLKSIGARKKLSPKQQAVFDKLCAKYLEA
jgi:hypothetical protein